MIITNKTNKIFFLFLGSIESITFNKIKMRISFDLKKQKYSEYN